MGVVGKSVKTNLGNIEIVAETACLSLIIATSQCSQGWPSTV